VFVFFTLDACKPIVGDHQNLTRNQFIVKITINTFDLTYLSIVYDDLLDLYQFCLLIQIDLVQFKKKDEWTSLLLKTN